VRPQWNICDLYTAENQIKLSNMAAADIGGKRFLYQEIFLQNWLCSDHETDMESDFENSPVEQL